jgi:hypothetical protein
MLKTRNLSPDAINALQIIMLEPSIAPWEDRVVPIHNWARVPADIFHDFHHEWISAINRSANQSLVGTSNYALAEHLSGVLGLQDLTLAKNPPQARYRITDPPKWYATKKKSVTIRHVSEDRVVAVLEIVSPGNKDGRSSLKMFVQKAHDLLDAGVHLSLVDLFPPTPRDPEGIHPAVWGDDAGDMFRFDPAKPLTCASYIAGLGAEAFVNPVAVGDKLPDLSVFLTPEEYIDVPLEATYQDAFNAVPDVWREVLEEE